MNKSMIYVLGIESGGVSWLAYVCSSRLLKCIVFAWNSGLAMRLPVMKWGSVTTLETTWIGAMFAEILHSQLSSGSQIHAHATMPPIPTQTSAGKINRLLMSPLCL